MDATQFLYLLGVLMAFGMLVFVVSYFATGKVVSSHTIDSQSKLFKKTNDENTDNIRQMIEQQNHYNEALLKSFETITSQQAEINFRQTRMMLAELHTEQNQVLRMVVKETILEVMKNGKNF